MELLYSPCISFNIFSKILFKSNRMLECSLACCRWDAPDFVWNDQFQRLLDYQKQHLKEGKQKSTSTVVPQHYPKDPQLAVWVKEQRQNRKNGILPGERVELLDSIGFVWDASSSPPSKQSFK